jgi:AI-2 transport protein TqsA
VIQEGLPKKTPRIDTQQIVKDLKNYVFNIVTNAFGTILGLISSMLFVVIFVLFLLLGRNPYTTHSQVYSDVVGKIRKYVGIRSSSPLPRDTGLGDPDAHRTQARRRLRDPGVPAELHPVHRSIIVTFLPVPIAVVQFQSSPWLIVLVVAIPGGIQNILGNIIEPKLQGEGLNLHPVTILLALSFWGLLWGIVGMFLAAPITAAIRIVLMQFDMLRPIAKIMAGDFTQLFPNDAVEHVLTGRVAGEVLEAAVEDDHFVGPADGVFEDLPSVLPTGQAGGRVLPGGEPRQAGHHLGI